MKAIKEPQSDSIERKPYIAIRIRADCSQQVEDGIYQLAIPTVELSKEENEMLDRLFPNTNNQIEKLLKVEALITSIVS